MKKKKIICVMLIFLILLIPSYQINAATNGWKINGQNKYYYINNKKITGSKKIGKYYYYFDKKGRMVKNKIVKIKGYNYYYQPNGKRCAEKNIQKQIGTKYYYLNSKSQVNFYKGFVTIDNKKYFFNSSGKSVSGWIVCPVGLAGWFVDEINGLYAVHTYIDFHDLCKNVEIRNSLEKITVPKIINLDISQEYLLNKFHNEGIDIDYV